MSAIVGSALPTPSPSHPTFPSPSEITDLRACITGEVVVKGEADEVVYRAAIQRFNEASISEAAVIVFVESDADVAAALEYAQKWKLQVVIACGRHSYYGASSTTGGLVVDLRRLKTVSIDQERLTITAGGGCQAVDLEAPLQELGLSVVMGAANDTGIGGLTLGGGSGYLTGQHGLVIDNLLAARVVLADGRVLEASETENADLFWAIRGGGSNFGVVTEFKYRVHKQGDVFFGPMIFTPDKNGAFLVLAPTLQDLVNSSAGKLAIFIGFIKGPGMPAVHPMSLVFYDGPEATARALLAPLYDLGPAMDMSKQQKYAEITMSSPALLGPSTHQHYATSSIPLSIPLDVPIVEGMMADLSALFEKYGEAVAPSKVAFEIRSYAVSGSVDPSATALSARSPGMACIVEVQHDGSQPHAEMRREVKAITEKAKRALQQKFPETRVASNPNFSTGMEMVAETFGGNIGRLRELKRRFDPEFVFNKWYPIAPAEA